MRLMILLVLRSPSVTWLNVKDKKRMIMQATEAGNETELSEMRELTPKHIAMTATRPRGT